MRRKAEPNKRIYTLNIIWTPPLYLQNKQWRQKRWKLPCYHILLFLSIYHPVRSQTPCFHLLVIFFLLVYCWVIIKTARNHLSRIQLEAGSTWHRESNASLLFYTLTPLLIDRTCIYKKNPSPKNSKKVILIRPPKAVRSIDEIVVCSRYSLRQGPECRQITEELIKNLGDVIHTENTAEYFEEKIYNKNIEKVRHSSMPKRLGETIVPWSSYGWISGASYQPSITNAVLLTLPVNSQWPSLFVRGLLVDQTIPDATTHLV